MLRKPWNMLLDMFPTASLFLGTNVGEALRFTWGQLSATQPSVIKEKICVEDFL